MATPAQAAARTITNFTPRSAVVGLTSATKTYAVSTSGCSWVGWTAKESDYSFYVHDRSAGDLHPLAE